MKVFIIGGTGLLGSEGARELLARAHQVTTLARRVPSKDAGLPEGMEIIPGNYMDMSDDELCALMTGCEGFVFAAGVSMIVEGVSLLIALSRV